MMGTEVDTTTAASNRATRKATAAAVMEKTMAAPVAVSDNKTRTEKSNLLNLRSIVGCTDVIMTTMDLNTRGKI